MEAANAECDTELCLSPGGRPRAAHDTPSDEKQQKITIFYSGNVCFSEVTEMQAKEIICMAEMMRSSSRGKSGETLQQLDCRGLSMKRSLQLFLQNRKDRAALAHQQPIFASKRQKEYFRRRRRLQAGDSSSST